MAKERARAPGRLSSLGLVLLVGSAGLASMALALERSAPDAGREIHSRVLDGKPAVATRGRQLILAENFRQPLDPRRWGTCHWWDPDRCTVASTGELEAYLPANVTTRRGTLRLEAREGPVTGPAGRTFPYSSGMVSTGPPAYEAPARFAFTYGYVEARLRLPAGRGLWPAFWLLPADQASRPEIDVIEVLGHEPERAQLHYHAAAARGRELDVGHDPVIEALADGGWHVFAVDWRPGRITWLVDGRPQWEITGRAVSDEPMYLVLNLAVGGRWAGPPDATTEFPAALEAEWIRVWQEGAQRRS